MSKPSRNGAYALENMGDGVCFVNGNTSFVRNVSGYSRFVIAIINEVWTQCNENIPGMGRSYEN